MRETVAMIEKKNLCSLHYLLKKKKKTHQNQVYFSKASKYGNFCAFPQILTNHILSYSNKNYCRRLQDSCSLVDEECSCALWIRIFDPFWFTQPKRNKVLNSKNDRMENWTNQQRMIHKIRMSRISSQEMEEFQTGLIYNPYR